MNRAIILEFVADHDKPINLILKNHNETSFFWFQLNQIGDHFKMETYIDCKYELITTLAAIKDRENFYYGSIKGESILLWCDHNIEYGKIILFKGHKSKSDVQRLHLVEKWLQSYKNKQHV